MLPKIISVTGLIGSGKDFVSNYIAEKYDYEIISLSELVHEAVRRNNLETTWQNLQKISTEYRTKYGMDYFGLIALKKANELIKEGKKVLIKEARRKEDIEQAKKEFGSDMLVIKVEADKKTRFERLKNRGTIKDPKTMDELEQREKREWELYFSSGIFDLVDATVNNEKDVDIFKEINAILNCMNIFIIGPQGSGKGTQAKILKEKYGLVHLSMGELLREEGASGSQRGKEIKKLIDNGNMVPDDWTIELLENRIRKQDCKNGVILDGFPRTRYQAEQLRNIIKINLVIVLDLNEEQSIERLSHRRQCVKCGFITTDKFKKCEKCGSDLYQREDDTEQGIKNRLDFYHKETEKVIDFFESKGVVYHIDGSQSIEEVDKQVDKIIAKLKK